MSYTALARTWRPKKFEEVIGQSHVVRALANALESGRVHHAYLFAGTRGIGKTTLARILAKALNCKQRKGAEPCGECEICVSVDEGRLVDLIEVDAASRTGVDDTRELLDNVQYTPTFADYKIYLIDEVHMLSRPSFNALLKTLEEPPEHVKFLLATTDPHKIPVTVLSRCLQFNLKRLPSKQIGEHLQTICESEQIAFEAAALGRLARAAAGSVRDGLSLLDQAIAFGDSNLTDQTVAEMLGALDQDYVIDLLDHIVAGEAATLLERIAAIDEQVPDYGAVLDEMASVIQRIAVVQLAGTDALGDDDDVAALQRLAEAVDPEFVQLLYQIAIVSGSDLKLAPDPRVGFEMALLRMVAFRPASPGPRAATGPAKPARKSRQQHKAAAQDAVPAPRAEAVAPGLSPVAADEIGDWLQFVATLNIKGMARQLAENIALTDSTPFELQFSIEPRNKHLLTDKIVKHLSDAIHERVGEGVRLSFNVREQTADTLAAKAAREAQVRQAQTERAIQEDKSVQDLLSTFGGEVVPGSVRPANGDGTIASKDEGTR